MSKLNTYQAIASIVGVIIAFFACVFAFIALIPAFGQWLSSNEPHSNSVEKPTTQEEKTIEIPGIICQGPDQTCNAPASICALHFYQFGGEEKTFLFSTNEQVLVESFNGTLFCWPTPPTFDECCTKHPIANIEDVEKAGISFSSIITSIDPDNLR